MLLRGILAGAIHDLTAERSGRREPLRLLLAHAETPAGAATCHDCGARVARPAGPPAELCELCYANRLVHGHPRGTTTAAPRGPMEPSNSAARRLRP